MPPGETQRKKAIARRELLLGLLRDGMRIGEACRAAGIPQQTWRSWRVEFPEFKFEADAAIRSRRAPGERGTDGTIAAQFIAFRQLYFANDTPAHHHRIIDTWVKAKAESITVVLAPPGHAKTTLMVDWICFRLARDPNYRACVISETGSHAEKVLRQIARRMSDEELFGPFIARYGPFKPDGRDLMKPWNSTNLTHVQATHDEKEGSIEAKGIDDQIYGARYDEIWLDDVQSVKSRNLTAKQLEKFQQDIVTRPMDEGRIYFIGTRVGPGDIYEALETENEEGRSLADTFLKLPAYDYRGDPLWPQMWPKERLEQRRTKLTEDIWARVYMQRPVSRQTATFTEELVNASLDAHRRAGEKRHEGVTVFGVDPALVGYTVVLTAELTRDTLIVIDMLRRRDCGSTETILRMVEEQAKLHSPSTGIFEMGAYQTALNRDVRLHEIAARYGFDVRDHSTAGRKADPVLGVSQMATSFVRGEISIPDHPESRVRMKPLLDELRSWRADVPTRQLIQDTVMALWFVWRYWQLEVRPSLDHHEPARLWRPTWMGDRPRGLRSA